MKANRQRVMHCPCGNAKVLALGVCSTCYTLKRQDEEYFGGGCGKRFWNVTGTVAACATRQIGTSDRSSCIIADRGNQCST